MSDESGFDCENEQPKQSNKLITFLIVLIAVGVVFFITIAVESLNEKPDYKIYRPRISVLALADTSY